jgi:hypothetical protein
VLAVIVGALYQLNRQPGVPATDSLWAEDGRIFMQQSFGQPWYKVIVEPYAGYAHILPRLISVGGRTVAAEHLAAYYAWTAALVVSILAVIVFVAIHGHVHTLIGRAVTAGSFMTLPLTSVECMNSVANLQWYLVASAFWVLLWRPRGWAATIIACVTVALAVASAPVALLLAPVAAIRLISLGSWRERLPGVAFGVGAVLQLGIMTGTSRLPTPIRPGVDEVARAFFVRVILGSVDGYSTASSHFRDWGWSVVVLAGLFVVVATLVAGTTLAGRCLVIAGLAEGLILFSFSVTYSWSPNLAPSGKEANLGASSRYTVASVLILTGILVVGLERLHQHITALPDWPSSTTVRMALRVLVVLAPLIYLVRVDLIEYGEYNRRAEGPRWTSEVARAEGACLKTRASQVMVSVSPGGPWLAALPCNKFRRVR